MRIPMVPCRPVYRSTSRPPATRETLFIDVTMSPTFAVMFDGSNASLPSAPTITMCSANVLFDAAAELVADADDVSETVTVVVTLTTATSVDVAAAD